MADTPASARPRGVSRRNFVTGVGAAGVGGLVVGGAAGWALKPSGGGVDVRRALGRVDQGRQRRPDHRSLLR